MIFSFFRLPLFIQIIFSDISQILIRLITILFSAFGFFPLHDYELLEIIEIALILWLFLNRFYLWYNNIKRQYTDLYIFGTVKKKTGGKVVVYHWIFLILYFLENKAFNLSYVNTLCKTFRAAIFFKYAIWWILSGGSYFFVLKNWTYRINTWRNQNEHQ